mmetsp:Transcript_45532/g.114151  ORF Transcript_45532/g.114151 Transcript_45532/m.114151 type:complete len:332 (+) Transcript_45532:6004-6999(+)
MRRTAESSSETTLQTPTGSSSPNTRAGASLKGTSTLHSLPNVRRLPFLSAPMAMTRTTNSRRGAWSSSRGACSLAASFQAVPRACLHCCAVPSPCWTSQTAGPSPCRPSWRSVARPTTASAARAALPAALPVPRARSRRTRSRPRGARRGPARRPCRSSPRGASRASASSSSSPRRKTPSSHPRHRRGTATRGTMAQRAAERGPPCRRRRRGPQHPGRGMRRRLCTARTSSRSRRGRTTGAGGSTRATWRLGWCTPTAWCLPCTTFSLPSRAQPTSKTTCMACRRLDRGQWGSSTGQASGRRVPPPQRQPRGGHRILTRWLHDRWRPHAPR